MPYDPSQPREPKGVPIGGEWKYDAVYAAARNGAGLPAENGLPIGNSIGGTKRVMNGNKFDTAIVVNSALETANKSNLDMARAEKSLRYYGNQNPTPEQIQKYAREYAALYQIEKMTGVNATGQTGKWDFTSAQSIHESFNSYLNRRIHGQHHRYTERYGK